MNVTGSIVVAIEDSAVAIVNALKSLPDDAKVKSVNQTGGYSGQGDMFYSPVKVTITFKWTI